MTLVCAAGCYAGADADGDAATTTAGTGGAATAGSDATGGPGDPGDSDGDSGGEDVDTVEGPTIRRLTAAEFAHSLRDLLGEVPISAVEADTLKDGFFAVGNATIAVSPAGVALYEQALAQATGAAFADAARAATVVACVPAQLGDVPCMRDAIATFGRRAWRRPLTGPEIERYLAVAAAVGEQTGDALAALRHAVWGLLSSPNFLYRVEIGEAGADGRVRFTGWELGSRLAYTLWNTTPDEALLDAAERGELDDPAGLRAQAERMLADPRARQGVENFVGELYGLWKLPEVFKDAAAFPDWTPSLRAAIRDDLLARVQDVVFGAPGDFLGLYDGTRVFVNNELARLYGLPEVEPDALRPAELPADGLRRGLIGSAGLLALNSLPLRTSATRRGAFISDALLCRVVPPPPPDVELDLDDEEGEGPRTLREKLEEHRVNPACSGCHGMMDPMGLSLEHFDSIGKYRPDDQGLTIDASGELDNMPFADGAELAGLLRDHPDAPGCLVRKLYTYATGRLPFYSEREVVALLADDLEQGGNRFDQLLLALVTRDDFRFANPEGTQVAPDEGDMP